MQGGRVLFEAFEASPTSKDVLAAPNSLEWDFPGCAAAIPLETYSNSSFQHELATFLEQASSESIKQFAARALKNGTTTFEVRDTVDPCMITQMLMTLLEANGSRVSPTILRKRVRDEVYWFKGAWKPWRRSPFWLVLRVAIQRHLSIVLGGGAGRLLYKFLVCMMLATLLNDSLQSLPLDLTMFLKAKLCRRLVKLEVDKHRAPVALRSCYEYMFDTFGPLFRQSALDAAGHTDLSWANFKNANQRKIPDLP